MSANKPEYAAQAQSTVVHTGLGTAASVPGTWTTTATMELSGAWETVSGDMETVNLNISDDLILLCRILADKEKYMDKYTYGFL